MAKTVTDECVSCGLPCLGNSCPYSNVVRYFCDECETETDVDDLYMYDGDMLCVDCLLKHFETARQAGFDYE